MNDRVRARFDVVGLGHTALDCLGVVPRFPEENMKLEMERLLVQGGGPAATAMVAVRRLGLSAALVAGVGDDLFGRMMMAGLEEEGVDTSGVLLRPGVASQFAFIMVDGRTAARTILWTRGSVPRLRPDEIDTKLILSGRLLLVDSLEPEGAAHAAREAGRAGIPVVIDAGTLREGIGEVLPHCDYIVGSELFGAQISGGEGVDRALEEMIGFGAEAAVVTLGERGCAALAGGRRIDCPGFDVDAADTTGAGDVFHGAFCFGILQGWDIERTCVFSNAVAAIACTRLGGRGGIPGIDGALAFLAGRRPDLFFPLRG